MTTFAAIVGDGSSVLATDDDPNTTTPDPSRIWTTPAGDGPCYITTLGASDNNIGEDYALVTIWGKDPEFSQWFVVLDVAVISRVMIGYANDYVLPRNMELFAQVFTNAGLNGLTQVGIGYLTDVVS